MKKFAYPSLILALIIVLGFTMYKKYTSKTNEAPALKERAVNVGLTSEWLNTEKAVEGLLDKIRRNPNDKKAKLQLAMAYVQEGRVTGDHAYYDEATLKLVADVLAKEPQNYEALSIKTTVLLSQHHFTEALSEATNIVTLNPDAAFGYGLLCDAYVELGKYPEAVAAADKMNALRPDLRSYSRISYLREIHGDYEGAKKAMELAMQSGVIGMEQTEWCRTQLGKLCEVTGDVASAENHYKIALEVRPEYAYALAGMGRLASQKGHYTEEASLFERAVESVNDPAFYDDLSEAYRLDNQQVKAEEAVKKVVTLLGGNHDTNPNLKHDTALPQHGHYADKELAEAYLKINDLEHALVHAQLELQRRPDNIDVNEVMAWVFYKNGENEKALNHIEKALKTGSQKAALLWKAGNIYIKNKQVEKGNTLINKALRVNKYLKTELL
jgi:tetratricopeptide (TPR) repeat protein